MKRAVNLAFLGDALDPWKGSLFESLQQSSVLRDFAVDPMASDWSAWRPEDVLLFTRLLRIDKSQLIPHNVCLASRQQYFGEIEHTGDLFLDPDTGIATGKGNIKHVRPAEIALLLRDSDRLLAVYQHGARGKTSHRVDEVCRVLNGAIADCKWSSYESGTVAMVFLSRSHERVAKVTAHFRHLLGRHAAGRIQTNTG
jgi:hypothetical protein